MGTKPEESCKKCRFYVPYLYDFDEFSTATNYGECRRYPPKPVPAEEIGFPVVEDACWCGEFRI